jgi:hypothetical protein
MIDNPADPQYFLQMFGNIQSQYNLSASYGTDGSYQDSNGLGFYRGTAINLVVDVSTGSPNFIAPVNSPTGLQADAIGSGSNMLTTLSWQRPTDVKASGYRIYYRHDSDLYYKELVTIQNVSTTSYSTSHSWAGDGVTPVCHYAVTSITADGKEGLFGPDIASNDDRDHDGLPDYQEIALGTDPTKADSDGDGLSDGYEVYLGTNPLKVDTDGDGYSDFEEVRLGTDPTDPNSRPDRLGAAAK